MDNGRHHLPNHLHQANTIVVSYYLCIIAIAFKVDFSSSQPSQNSICISTTTLFL